VQYDPVLAKWMMMYGCFDDKALYNPRNRRGIFLRMADAPWGPWTEPQLVFDPGNGGYCYFMHRQDAKCSAGAPNPADLGLRDDNDPEKNKWGGEYDACLLPPRYNKYSDGSLTLYWVMSTWNPYQVVLMKTDISRPPWWKRFVMKDRTPMGR
jgi:hypothetical protein